MHIIGGGIGGLALALALHRVGVSARVYEQAPEIGAIGAGIGLWPGALQGLRTLGVAQWFWDLPVCPFRWAETATPDGRTLTGFAVATHAFRDDECLCSHIFTYTSVYAPNGQWPKYHKS
jgi:2-polyprenyl-6-methoxyphenol hydroxylase-like FAD-dependent oxidoreductase